MTPQHEAYLAQNSLHVCRYCGVMSSYPACGCRGDEGGEMADEHEYSRLWPDTVEFERQMLASGWTLETAREGRSFWRTDGSRFRSVGYFRAYNHWQQNGRAMAGWLRDAQ